MLRFKTLTIKNFMSVGENVQTIDLENGGLTLILGENLDTADDASVGRNGCGKSAILNAFSYALYGKPLDPDIKRIDGLVNNINERGMFVITEFDKDGHRYKIERGRKPNFFKFIVDDAHVNIEESDESQGEGRHTQEEVEKILGLSHNLFKHIIALNTTTLPFLSMSAKNQREFIEELLGIAQLSEKAEVLKDLLKESRSIIRQEEIKIQTIQDGNASIEKSIRDLDRRTSIWDKKHVERVIDIEQAIDALSDVDIDFEIESHKQLALFNEIESGVNSLSRDIERIQRNISSQEIQLTKLENNLKDALEKKCPTCSQELHDHNHESIIENLQHDVDKVKSVIDTYQSESTELADQLEQLVAEQEKLGSKPETFYSDLESAYNHKNSISLLESELRTAKKEINPYIEQIEQLKKSGLREINYDKLNEVSRQRDHQDFLYKLLTNKDSFIRKKIIDQNLSYLNARLSGYLEKLGLPHIVKFQNDLNVDITYLGRSLDFGNLSRGEQTRLILSLCWSFRDIFELLNHPVNILFVDELLDNGLDGQGVENAMGVIKRKMSQERSKEVFVISHREELISKIGNVLKVVKEGGFTSLMFESDFNL